MLVCAFGASADPEIANAARRDNARLEPAGIWSCIVYDDPVRGDERIVLSLGHDGSAHVAIQSASSISVWRRISDWTVDERNILHVRDSRTYRELSADLERAMLAGTWRSDFGGGGWWCSARHTLVSQPLNLRRAPTEFFVPALVPKVMVSPAYPREAVREAREGRVVVCFLVDPAGAIVAPELVEVSDEIFAEPTLRALTRSRYNELEESVVARSGCRTYTYQLDANY